MYYFCLLIIFPTVFGSHPDPLPCVRAMVAAARVIPTLDQETVPIFRAVSGKVQITDRQTVFDGVSEDDLLGHGFFLSNYSFAQYNTEITRPADHPYFRVPGLPVFLNFSEAVFYISNKRYRSPPAVIETRIPIVDLFGEGAKISLIQNRGQVPSMNDIQAHIAGTKRIRGEHYIRGIGGYDLRALRPSERVYRPVEFSDHQISGGFTLVPSSK